MKISRSITLALALITATPTVFQAHKDSATSASKDVPCSACKATIGTAVAFVLFAACYIRLTTKPTAKSRVDRSWKEYFKETAQLLNITQIFTQEYWERFDKLIIGDQLKVLDMHTEVDEEDGCVTYKDKWVKSYPSGMFGYIDSYLLRSLKTLFESIDNLKKCGDYINVDGVCWE